MLMHVYPQYWPGLTKTALDVTVQTGSWFEDLSVHTDACNESANIGHTDGGAAGWRVRISQSYVLSQAVVQEHTQYSVVSPEASVDAMQVRAAGARLSYGMIFRAVLLTYGRSVVPI